MISTVSIVRVIPLAAGWSVALLGLAVLVGWYFGAVSIIQVLPTLVPMQFNTALGFLLGGLGLLVAVKGRANVSFMLGMIVAAIGALTLVEYLVGLDLGIDEMFMRHYITVETSTPGRMAPNTALCFLLSGSALVAGMGRRWAAAGLLGGMVVGLGVVALTGYLSDTPAAYGWGKWTRMAVHTSAGFMALGSGLLAHAWGREQAATGEAERWLPSVAGISLGIVAVTLWQALHAEEQEVARKFGVDADFVADELMLVFGMAVAAAVYQAFASARRARLAARAAGAEVAERRLAEQRLAESEERFRTYFEMGMVGFAETSPEKGWVRVNDELCRMLGYAHDEIVALTWAELTHPDDLAPDMARFESLLAGEIDGYSMEKRFIRKDGLVVPTIMSVRVRRRADGAPDYLFAVLQDVSTLKGLEEQLRRSNAELEQFAYVASHDLQEPLRNVTTYTQLLDRRFGESANEEAREFLQLSIAAAKRASTLIRDLLAFSRVAAQTESPVPTDSGRIMEEVLRDMDALVRESGAMISVGPLPWVAAVPAPLGHVLMNLITNAIKYRASERRPEIDVSAERTGAEWTFTVRDNGIGIDPQYFDRVFMIFKRLHSQEAYEGTGIGLAICKRVVERLGGRIWVESAPGQGSAFRFTLRAVESPPHI